MGRLGAGNSIIAPIFALREKKRSEIISLLRDDVQRLRADDPDLKFWLIGSYAVGNWDSNSDIDIVCVSKMKYYETNFNVSNQYPMDVFSLTETEFRRRIDGSALFKQAINNGISL